MKARWIDHGQLQEEIREPDQSQIMVDILDYVKGFGFSSWQDGKPQES